MWIRMLLVVVIAAAVFGNREVRAAGAERTSPRARTGPVEAPVEAAHDPSCVETYWNAVEAGYYFPAGAGVEVLDDLHLGPIRVEDLCAFDLGYYKESPGTTNATVTFYSGSVGDEPPGGALASFPVTGLSSGENYVHVEVPATLLEQDVWMGVSFDAADAGLLLGHPVWPGAGDDYFFMTPPGEFHTFGGNPRANFMLVVRANGTVVEVPPGVDATAARGFLSGPSPNPARRGFDLRFAVPEAGRVQLQVIDVAGRIVAVLRDEVLPPGSYASSWDGRGIAGLRASPGVYLVRLLMPRFAASRRVVLMR